MIPLQRFSGGVLAGIIRRQPHSPERTAFAWQLAVGPVLARSTTVALDDGVLTVRPRDERWVPEVKRSSATILKRMQDLLGPQSVVRIEIVPTLELI